MEEANSYLRKGLSPRGERLSLSQTSQGVGGSMLTDPSHLQIEHFSHYSKGPPTSIQVQQTLEPVLSENVFI